MPDENQKQYELTFILSPNLKEGEIVSIEQGIEKDIKNFGGNLKKKKEPEKRNLSYPIKKLQSGYFWTINFLFNPEKLEELLSIFKHKKEVLRYIITSAIEAPASFVKAPVSRKKLEVKKLAEEVTEKEIKTLKKAGEKKEGSKPKLEEIDKKLEEILGI